MTDYSSNLPKEDFKLYFDLLQSDNKPIFLSNDAFDMITQSSTDALINRKNEPSKSEFVSQKTIASMCSSLEDKLDIDTRDKSTDTYPYFFEHADLLNQAYPEKQRNPVESFDPIFYDRLQANKSDIVDDLNLLSLLNSNMSNRSTLPSDSDLQNSTLDENEGHTVNRQMNKQKLHSLLSGALSQYTADTNLHDLDHSQPLEGYGTEQESIYLSTSLDSLGTQLPALAPVVSRRKVQYRKTRLCPWFFSGKCVMGEKCNYAHAQSELRGRPDLTRTRFCSKADSCTNPSCRFAHYNTELRATGAFYRTKLCKFWQQGFCTAGEYCRHAHGLEQLRDPFDDAYKNSTTLLTKPIAHQFDYTEHPEKFGLNSFEMNSSCLMSQMSNGSFDAREDECPLPRAQFASERSKEVESHLNEEDLYEVLKILLSEQKNKGVKKPNTPSNDSTTTPFTPSSSGLNDSLQGSCVPHIDRFESTDSHNGLSYHIF